MQEIHEQVFGRAEIAKKDRARMEEQREESMNTYHSAALIRRLKPLTLHLPATS